MKKNLNKVPNIFIAKIQASNNNAFIAATTVEAKKSDIAAGLYHHIGVALSEDTEVVVNGDIYPLPENGRYSKRNQEGKFITRKDLPKIYKQFYYGERPIFGDYSKGTFSLIVTKLVYQKEFVPPEEVTISTEILNDYRSGDDHVYILKVMVNKVMDKNDNSFYSDLLFCLNILQENINKSDVFEAEAAQADYLRTLNIGWELLPLGNRDILDELLGGGGGRPLTDQQRGIIQERYNYLESLNPTQWIKGISGMRRYFGAKFADNIVVLENLDYGNAIYVMFDNWEELSTLSRTELLKKTNRDFERIKHTGNGWRTKLQMVIADRLNRN
ncbi:hypothetical protein [Mucilaginibacter panaciglaebae]|uniref:Uncharacterized protein n=1 Tax=Mucilaginibacter panaciglaebae TaxID=502331 RepID=A0ABP7WNB5_9SPHI